jgi:hypothetical protein
METAKCADKSKNLSPPTWPKSNSQCNEILLLVMFAHLFFWILNLPLHKTIHSEQLPASAVFSSKNQITNASLVQVEFHRTHYAHLTLQYLLEAAESDAVDRFWTVDLIGPHSQNTNTMPFSPHYTA